MLATAAIPIFHLFLVNVGKRCAGVVAERLLLLLLPVIRIKENYEASGNSCIPKHLVYQHYKDFCEDNNIQFTNMANFGT